MGRICLLCTRCGITGAVHFKLALTHNLALYVLKLQPVVVFLIQSKLSLTLMGVLSE